MTEECGHTVQESPCPICEIEELSKRLNEGHAELTQLVNKVRAGTEAAPEPEPEPEPNPPPVRYDYRIIGRHSLNELEQVVRGLENEGWEIQDSEVDMTLPQALRATDPRTAGVKGFISVNAKRKQTESPVALVETEPDVIEGESAPVESGGDVVE
jgi:hypothetical protein